MLPFGETNLLLCKFMYVYFTLPKVLGAGGWHLLLCFPLIFIFSSLVLFHCFIILLSLLITHHSRDRSFSISSTTAADGKVFVRGLCFLFSFQQERYSLPLIPCSRLITELISTTYFYSFTNYLELSS